MSPEIRELLELIKDCRSKDEARLMLSACGCEVSRFGAVSISPGMYVQAVDGSVYICDYGWGKYVKYSELKAFLDRSGSCTPPSSTY